jgi:membrane protein required for colicin V production
MNWLDIVLICLTGAGLVKGLFDGLIRQVVSLIALVAGIFFCGKAAAWLKEYLISLNWFPAEGVSIMSYVLGFLLIAGVVLAAGEIVHRLVGSTPLSMVNHLFGGVFGILLTLLFISLFFNLMELIDKGSVLIPVQAKLDSRLYYPIKEIIPTVFPHSLFVN